MKKIYLFIGFLAFMASGCVKIDFSSNPSIPECTNDSTSCKVIVKDFYTKLPISNVVITSDSIEPICVYGCFHPFFSAKTDTSGMVEYGFANPSKYTYVDVKILLDTSKYATGYSAILKKGCENIFEVNPKPCTFIDLTINNQSGHPIKLSNVFTRLSDNPIISNYGTIDYRTMNDSLAINGLKKIRLKSNPDENIIVTIAYDINQRKTCTITTNTDSIFSLNIDITQ